MDFLGLNSQNPYYTCSCHEKVVPNEKCDAMLSFLPARQKHIPHISLYHSQHRQKTCSVNTYPMNFSITILRLHEKCQIESCNINYMLFKNLATQQENLDLSEFRSLSKKVPSSGLARFYTSYWGSHDML